MITHNQTTVLSLMNWCNCVILILLVSKSRINIFQLPKQRMTRRAKLEQQSAGTARDMQGHFRPSTKRVCVQVSCGLFAV